MPRAQADNRTNSRDGRSMPVTPLLADQVLSYGMSTASLELPPIA
jgi:hypothetical protein